MSTIMLSVAISYCYAECRHVECNYAECRYARVPWRLFKTYLSWSIGIYSARDNLKLWDTWQARGNLHKYSPSLLRCNKCNSVTQNAVIKSGKRQLHQSDCRKFVSLVWLQTHITCGHRDSSVRLERANKDCQGNARTGSFYTGLTSAEG
jgi:hypothetical protein